MPNTAPTRALEYGHVGHICIGGSCWVCQFQVVCLPFPRVGYLLIPNANVVSGGIWAEHLSAFCLLPMVRGFGTFPKCIMQVMMCPAL